MSVEFNVGTLLKAEIHILLEDEHNQVQQRKDYNEHNYELVGN